MQTRTVFVTWAAVVTLFLATTTSGGQFPRSDVIDFTSPVRLEKLFNLEVDLVILADYIYKAEMKAHDGDVHHLEFLNKTVSYVRDIHSMIESVELYLAHPINVFHLTKRMRTRWRHLVDSLQDNAYCKRKLQTRLETLMETMPATEPLLEVTYAFAKLINTFHVPMSDAVRGTISGLQAVQPLSIEDVFDIARVAYDRDDFYTAIVWLNQTLDMMDKEADDELAGFSFTKTRVLSMLSSGNFKMERPTEALRIADAILKIDPSHERAKINRKYYEQILKSRKDGDRPLEWRIGGSKFCTNRRKLCSHVTRDKEFVHTTTQPNLQCYVMSGWKGCPWTVYKVEILNKKPLIMIIHQASRDNFTDPFRNESRAQMLKESYRNLAAYPEERLSFPKINMLSHSRAAKTFTLTRERRIMSPYRMSKMEIRNFGLMGMCVKPAKNLKQFNEGGRIATIVLATSQNATGGNLVFPNEGVVAPVIKNTMIFWYSTSTQPAVCPSLYDTIWYIWQSFYEKNGPTCRKSDRQFLPYRYNIIFD